MATAEISEYIELLVKRLESHPDRAAEMLKTLSKKDSDTYLNEEEKAAISNAKRKMVLYKAQTKLMGLVLDDKKPKKKKKRYYYVDSFGFQKWYYK